jgi:hypothetical protein
MTASAESQLRVAAPFGWRTVTPLVMGSALNPVNSSVIATALVPIAAALHVPVGRTLILVSSLYLACAIAQASWPRNSARAGSSSPGSCWCCSAAWSAAWALTWPSWSWPGS